MVYILYPFINLNKNCRDTVILNKRLIVLNNICSSKMRAKQPIPLFTLYLFTLRLRMTFFDERTTYRYTKNKFVVSIYINRLTIQCHRFFEHTTCIL